MDFFSQRARIALAAVVEIGLHKTPVTQGVLAKRMGVTGRYLEPILQALVAEDVLKGQRGPLGGYLLARADNHISAGLIVRIAYPSGYSVPCGMRVGKLVDRELNRAVKYMVSRLDSVTIAELCADARSAGFDTKDAHQMVEA